MKMGVTFGRAARDARLERGIPLKRIASELGFTSAYLSDIERGNRNPPAEDKLRLWAAVIGYDPDVFVHLAETDRSSVELSIDGNRIKGELASLLAWAWNTMTEQQGRALVDAATKILGDADDEPS
jgi:transcriptional regulator with XRE-family HTH domain